MTKPLEGVRILEVAQAAFVPSAALVLVDWGADVIKVEHPERGDMVRGISVVGVDPHPSGIRYLWEIFNRGKKSVGLDIGHPAGREVMLRLVDESDVFLTNFLGSARAAAADRTRRHLRPEPEHRLRTRHQPWPARTRRGARRLRPDLLLVAERHGRRVDAGRLRLPHHDPGAVVRRFAVRDGHGRRHRGRAVPP